MRTKNNPPEKDIARKGGEDINSDVRMKRSDFVKQNVLKNLLIAQKQSAENGDAKSVICLSKYLLRMFNERHDEFIKFSPESDE